MPRVCQICDKWAQSWNNRSHSMRATRRTFKPNILNKYITDMYGMKVRVRLCSRCYKKLQSEWAL